MSNPYPIFWPTLNCATSDGYYVDNSNVQMPSMYSHIFNYALRSGQYVGNVDIERQRFFSVVVQLEQEKRTLSAWNSQLVQENAALKAEIALLKKGQGNATNSAEEGPTNAFGQPSKNAAESVTMPDQGQTTREAEKPPMRILSSDELIDALIAAEEAGGDDIDLLLIDTSSEKTPLNVGTVLQNDISNVERPNLITTSNVARPPQPASDDGLRAIVDNAFGQDFKRIVSSILEKHSPSKRPRFQLVGNGHNSEEEGADAIECIGIVQMRPSSSSCSFTAENVFVPPPKTPPPPITPPLPPPPSVKERPSVGAKMFESTIADEEIVFEQQQAAAPAEEQQRHNNAPQNDVDDEVHFVDDVCRSKWVPSMQKREPTTQWEEIVVEDDEQEAATTIGLSDMPSEPEPGSMVNGCTRRIWLQPSSICVDKNTTETSSPATAPRGMKQEQI